MQGLDMKWTAHVCRHHTVSAETQSLTMKLFMAQFVNTALSSLVANMYIPALYKRLQDTFLGHLIFQVQSELSLQCTVRHHCNAQSGIIASLLSLKWPLSMMSGSWLFSDQLVLPPTLARKGNSHVVKMINAHDLLEASIPFCATSILQVSIASCCTILYPFQAPNALCQCHHTVAFTETADCDGSCSDPC